MKSQLSEFAKIAPGLREKNARNIREIANTPVCRYIKIAGR